MSVCSLRTEHNNLSWIGMADCYWNWAILGLSNFSFQYILALPAKIYSSQANIWCQSYKMCSLIWHIWGWTSSSSRLNHISLIKAFLTLGGEFNWLMNDLCTLFFLHYIESKLVEMLAARGNTVVYMKWNQLLSSNTSIFTTNKERRHRDVLNCFTQNPCITLLL